MPHVIVKLYAGRSARQKAKLAAQITQAVTTGVQCPDTAVSVGIEDVEPLDWVEQVYKPDILGKPYKLYKRPGYNPL